MPKTLKLCDFAALEIADFEYDLNTISKIAD